LHEIFAFDLAGINGGCASNYGFCGRDVIISRDNINSDIINSSDKTNIEVI